MWWLLEDEKSAIKALVHHKAFNNKIMILETPMDGKKSLYKEEIILLSNE